MGFDVIYFPPVHPIGTSARKGRNNAVSCQPGEPGVPYAIGNRHQGCPNGGGHCDVAPELGTLEDFDWLLGEIKARGMEVALDFAVNCSPDHPYVSDHPDWFFHRPDGTYHGQPSHGWNGAPLEPVGDPLLAGVGPGAWAQRADVPDMTHHGDVKIVPLRVATDHKVAARDVNPIGLPVIAGDGEVAGHVKDMWIDRAEMMFRYLEIELPSGQRVLAPTPFARIRRTEVELTAILSTQFANVPALRNPDQITLLEEEKVSAYYGAGTLYATPHRQEPIF